MVCKSFPAVRSCHVSGGNVNAIELVNYYKIKRDGGLIGSSYHFFLLLFFFLSIGM